MFQLKAIHISVTPGPRQGHLGPHLASQGQCHKVIIVRVIEKCLNQRTFISKTMNIEHLYIINIQIKGKIHFAFKLI